MEIFNKIINGIEGLDKKAAKEAVVRLDSLAKPIGSLGRLEDIAVQLAGITGR